MEGAKIAMNDKTNTTQGLIIQNKEGDTTPEPGSLTNDATGKTMFMGATARFEIEPPAEGVILVGRMVFNFRSIDADTGEPIAKKYLITDLKVTKPDNPVTLHYTDEGIDAPKQKISLTSEYMSLSLSQIQEMARYIKDIRIITKPHEEQYNQAWAEIQELVQSGEQPRIAKKKVKKALLAQYGGSERPRAFDQAMYRRGYGELLQNATY